MNITTKATLQILFGAASLGAIGIIVRLADTDLPPFTQSFARICISMLFISIYITFKHKWDFVSIFQDKQTMLYVLTAGLVGYTLMASAFTYSILYTSITNTFFLLYTAPFFVIFFEALINRQYPSKQIIGVLFVSLLGIAFIFNPNNMLDNLTGNLFGLLTGISYAVYIFISKQLHKKLSPETITFSTKFVGALGLMLCMLLIEHRELGNLNASSSIVGYIILAGLLVFIGYLLLNLGLKQISATNSSLLLLFEPVSAALSDLLIFNEKIPLFTCIGIGLILVSSIYVSIRINNHE